MNNYYQWQKNNVDHEEILYGSLGWGRVPQDVKIWKRFRISLLA